MVNNMEGITHASRIMKLVAQTSSSRMRQDAPSSRASWMLAAWLVLPLASAELNALVSLPAGNQDNKPSDICLRFDQAQLLVIGRHAHDEAKRSQMHGMGGKGPPKGRFEMNGEMSVASTRRPSSARTVTALGSATTSSLPSPGTCASSTFKISPKCVSPAGDSSRPWCCMSVHGMTSTVHAKRSCMSKSKSAREALQEKEGLCRRLTGVFLILHESLGAPCHTRQPQWLAAGSTCH
jgi:hypothetical protein